MCIRDRGGTTTNIGVIKDGRPAIDYSVVGGHRTYISSLDVRDLGVAGGSMVRADKNGVKDVGPRSAHIAGLDYAVSVSYTHLDVYKRQEERYMLMPVGQLWCWIFCRTSSR